MRSGDFFLTSPLKKMPIFTFSDVKMGTNPVIY